MCNGSGSFKVRMQGPTTQSTTKAELVAAALATKEAVYCAGMVEELGLEETLKCAPIHIDNTSALRLAGNNTNSSRAKKRDSEVLLLYVSEKISDGKVSIAYE